MHVDMDAFFASIEQLDHPDYQGHPVIVGGLSSRGVVATCSYEARKFGGVHSVMPISRAKKLCPDGIYVYPRMDRYKEVSHQIFLIMKEFTPYIEPLSIDEAFLEVSGMSTMYKGPKELGRAIKDRVYEETGSSFPPDWRRINFSPSSHPIWTSRTVSLSFLTAVRNRCWRRCRSSVSGGVGPHTEKCLRKGGFHVMRDIQSLTDESALIPLVGNQARRIWELANGIDNRPVETDRKIQSVGAEETYEEDLSDGNSIALEFRYFANRLSKRLRKRNLQGHTVSIKVRYGDFSTVSRQKRLDTPTDHEHIFYETAQLLWNKLMADHTSGCGDLAGKAGNIRDASRTTAGGPVATVARGGGSHTAGAAEFINPPKPVRLLGLSVSGLDEEVPVQDSLFVSTQDTTENKLAGVLDALESKFGETAVMSGALWRRFHGEAGGSRRKRSELKSATDAGTADDKLPLDEDPD